MRNGVFKLREVLIVLGSPNTPDGELSDISKSRLDYCFSYYKKGKFVLCTGGWGAHFNTSPHSHATYSKSYLLEKGVYEKDFLDFALSSNTVDDAVKIKPILAKLTNVTLIIITSDYHVDRVRLIFDVILDGYHKKIIGVKSNLKQKEYEMLVQHEKKAIRSIVENGLTYNHNK